MFGWDLPPGCTLADIDAAFDAEDEDEQSYDATVAEARAADMCDESADAKKRSGEVLLIAQRFFDQHIVGESSEDQIAAIAELIGYGGDLDEIMRKMALM